MIKTQPFDGVQGVYCVGKTDKLNPNHCIVSTSVVNVAFSFLAATHDRGKQWAGAELHKVAIVEEKAENVILCAHAKMECKQLLELN